MPSNPSRWLWLAPLSVSVLAGWLMHQGIAAEPLRLSATPPAAGDSAYPAPNVDAARPPEPPAPAF